MRMKKISRRTVVQTAGVALALGSGVLEAVAAPKAKAGPRAIKNAHLSAGTDKGEWRTYGGDLNSQRYSALDQIGAGNFNSLQPAWTLKGQDFGIEADGTFQAVPLVVKGVMYVSTGNDRTVLALDAATGKLIWKYFLDEGPARTRAAPRPGGG